ncbi:MAG TPA: HNH endonuclease, partial [Bacteroidetes bacterium]|nr:HNH endonuclease [Bacteroidota bacterium]
SFGRFVPQRFLSPFFSNELRGKKDAQKDKLIKELANEFFDGNKPPIYRFAGNKIEIHPIWLHYLKQNSSIIEGYLFWKLTGYLQSRNPNIPNISKKIIPPDNLRNLSAARRFWNFVLQQMPVHCLYSKTEMKVGKYSIDHFVPWSFVAHDMLWNLAPIEKNVNSSKSNSLPNMDRYFIAFSKLQYQAYQIVYKAGKYSLLEDYVMLFNKNNKAIASYSESDFTEGLHKRISPLIQIATNSGFVPNWTYK